MKITDKMRMDFLSKDVAMITSTSTDHFVVYPVGPNGEAEEGVTLRQAIDAAIRAGERNKI